MHAWIWQITFGILLAVLFFWNQVIAWIRRQAGPEAVFPLGYLFACIYALTAILAIDRTSTLTPIPRFEDMFLVGIALTAYFFNTKPAACLLAMGIAVSVWILPPLDRFSGASQVDFYRLLSFALVSGLLIFVINRLKMKAQTRESRLGFLFAAVYAGLATAVAFLGFRAQPLPRFTDIFLIGIAITAYLFTATPAAYLLLISITVAAWILPPAGSFAIASPANCYRLCSFAAVAGLLIFLTGRLKKWSDQRNSALREN
jgi:Domain of unknown function (DUF4118)